MFFDWDKADITPEAATTLDGAVAAYQNCGGGETLTLGGYTDRSGSDQYNLGLAARRNETVENYLVSKGVPQGSISAQPIRAYRPPTVCANCRTGVSRSPGTKRSGK